MAAQVTTAAVDCGGGGSCAAGTAVALAAPNAAVRAGHVVTGAGIADTLTVASTTGVCTGADDGSGTAGSYTGGSFAGHDFSAPEFTPTPEELKAILENVPGVATSRAIEATTTASVT